MAAKGTTWRRIYFLLILIRVYFALSPSYLHPDEHFQGPEFIAGRVFGYTVHQTWEFTSDHPIRSTLPLWLLYGTPMLLLRWFGRVIGYDISPSGIYWTLRMLMLVLSIVFGDMAVYHLAGSPRAGRIAVLLFASSYVTWTFQTHTFSNGLETLLVCWSLLLIQRLRRDKERLHSLASFILGAMIMFGIFNRITFPAFLLLPSLALLSHFQRRPLSLVFIGLGALLVALIAIYIDTVSYKTAEMIIAEVFKHPVITPVNNLLYNVDSANLAQHGIHARYQHLLVNVPMLIGPAAALLYSSWRSISSPAVSSAVSGVMLLSIFPHQEARFLLPAVPLILSSTRLPRRPKLRKVWIGSWILFNAVLGLLMGVYHQGGVVPSQMYIEQTTENITHAFWWKTYMPPTWLLGAKTKTLKTHDLMGISGPEMADAVSAVVPICGMGSEGDDVVYLIAPRSAYFLKRYQGFSMSSSSPLAAACPSVSEPSTPGDVKSEACSRQDISLEHVWSHTAHLNLDDMDFGEDGVTATLKRVIGDRGLIVWRVKRNC